MPNNSPAMTRLDHMIADRKRIARRNALVSYALASASLVLAALAIVLAVLSAAPADATTNETPGKLVGFVCTVDEDKASGLTVCYVPRSDRIG